MIELLGKQEFDRKRIEDAHAFEIELPGYMSQPELKLKRHFLEDAEKLIGSWVAAGVDPRQQYDCRLARFYMWAQTCDHVYMAVYVPAGTGQLNYRNFDESLRSW